MNTWDDYHMFYFDKFWNELCLFDLKITFNDLRNHIVSIIKEGQGDSYRTDDLLSEKLIKCYNFEEDQVRFISSIIAPEISIIIDQLDKDNPLIEKYNRLISYYLKVANTNTNVSYAERYIRFIYNEVSINSWFRNLSSTEDQIIFLNLIYIYIVEFKKRSSIFDEYANHLIQLLYNLSSQVEDNESDLQSFDEKGPSNKIKAWILIFEKDDNLTIKDNAIKMLKDNNWDSSYKALGNAFTKLQQVALKIKKATPNDKNALYEAIKYLDGDAKLKAKKLFLQLSDNTTP